jgi:hypothetical protein
MIYKFESKGNSSKELEVEQNDGKTAVVRIINNDFGEYSSFQLDSVQVYNLIGALHSIQTKIKNFKED